MAKPRCWYLFVKISCTALRFGFYDRVNVFRLSSSDEALKCAKSWRENGWKTEGVEVFEVAAFKWSLIYQEGEV